MTDDDLPVRDLRGRDRRPTTPDQICPICARRAAVPAEGWAALDHRRRADRRRPPPWSGSRSSRTCSGWLRTRGRHRTADHARPDRGGQPALGPTRSDHRRGHRPRPSPRSGGRRSPRATRTCTASSSAWAEALTRRCWSTPRTRSGCSGAVTRSSCGPGERRVMSDDHPVRAGRPLPGQRRGAVEQPARAAGACCWPVTRSSPTRTAPPRSCAATPTGSRCPAAVVQRLADATDRLDVRPALQQLRRHHRRRRPSGGPLLRRPTRGLGAWRLRPPDLIAATRHRSDPGSADCPVVG